MRRAISFGAALLAVGVLGGGCYCRDVTGPAASDNSARVRAAYANLGAREDAHYQSATVATDAAALRGETERYTVDMDSLMGAMMDSCTAMGMGGMMRDHDMGRMRDLASGMGDTIRGHHARMDSLTTLNEMRAECDDHHDAMLERMDQMHDALPGRGMMGGGMM